MAGKKPSRTAEGPIKAWGLKEIEELVDVLMDREVTEFELEQGGTKIRLKRGSYTVSSLIGSETYVPDPAVPPPPPPIAVPAPPRDPVLAVPAPEARAVEAPPPPPPAEELYVMKSPIVGTFYAAPAPNAPPFVQVGDAVELGQVLCIIEAMKLMNELEAEVAGEIARIFVETGQPVEYGQSLFAIKPTQGK